MTIELKLILQVLGLVLSVLVVYLRLRKELRDEFAKRCDGQDMTIEAIRQDAENRRVETAVLTERLTAFVNELKRVRNGGTRYGPKGP